ncbi:MAG TPA: Flp family type IVb pilin [Alphaproteobacteria bacterium]|nr:Flp family type IVb pilin [Alphaproteobacteria bacterium]
MGRFLRDQTGVTTIEYGLIAGFVLCAIIGMLFLISPQVPVPFQRISDGITGSVGP